MNNQPNWSELILGGILGGLIGLIIQRLWTVLSKPKIIFSVSDDATFPINNKLAKLLQVHVVNKKKNLILSIIFGNNTLHNARVWIDFCDFKTGVNLLSIDGRWSTKKEPVDYITKTADVAEALIIQREIIPPNESSDIPVALKENLEKEIWGFNNKSYLSNLKNPDYKLNGKRYLIKIRIASEGKEWSQEFILINLGRNHSDFKLEMRS